MLLQDSRGRFQKGHTGGSSYTTSRHKKKIEYEGRFFSAIDNSEISFEDLVAKKLRECMEDGNERLFDIFLKYILPKPTETVQIEQERDDSLYAGLYEDKEKREAVRLILKETQEKVEALRTMQ